MPFERCRSGNLACPDAAGRDRRIGVESGHLQAPPPRRKECGNHTHYVSNSPRVTVRVNSGATWGYVRTRDRCQIDVRSHRFPTGLTC
jgi:hypothetical protein